jgi:outer membrane protein OmpA-like peptidoglycan-associated protein
MFPRLVMAVPIAALVLSGTTACATKKFVRTSVGEVNEKVDTLGRSLEETQERTRKNEAAISDVDKRAQAAASAASTAASAADQKAAAAGQSAQQANSRAGEAATAATTANAKAEEVDKFAKRMVYEVTLSEDQGNFKFGKADLPDEAKAKLDEMVTAIKADPKGAYFEIEGHTDNVGATEINERLGLQRAEAVKAYLYEQHKIPLHRMNVISYGEAKPVEKNNTSKGRAMNRRVVLRVLA